MADPVETEKTENKNLFAYTHGSYWEGSQYPYWVQCVLAATLGIVGLDHLFFHSPVTAAQKMFANVFGLGIWYFYDLIQLLGDKEYVQKYGLSRPVIGPTGLAYQSFQTIVEDAKKNQANLPPQKSLNSLFLFVAYALFVFVPFGLSNFLSGDTAGGFVKLLLTVSLFFGVVLLWNVFDFFMMLYKPTSLFEKGTNNIPPFSWIFGEYGDAWNIMKPSVVAEKMKENSEPKGSIVTRLFKPLLDFFGLSAILNLVGQAKCAAEPVIAQAQQTIAAASTAVEGGMELASAVPKVATKVGESMSAFTDPAKLKAAASLATATTSAMTGGGIATAISDLDTWVLISIGVLVVGGFTLSAIRTVQKKTTQKNDNPVEPQSFTRDDPPPQPRSL